ncbi:MAG TPA: hypothetical protein VI298_07430 [Geobacteraceae bacterium]
MEQHYIWLFNKSDNRGLWGAFLCSLLLHGLMFAVMSTTTVFFPLAGDNTKLDIVWLYPSLLFGGETETPPPVQTLPPEEKQSPLSDSNETALKKLPVQEREPVEKTAEARNLKDVAPTPPSPAPEEEVKPSPAVAEPLSPETEPEPEMSLPVETPPVQPAEAKTEPHEKVAAKESPPPAEKVLAVEKKSEAKTNPPVDKTEIPKAVNPAPAPAATPPPASASPVISRTTPLPNEKPQVPVQQTVAKIAPAPQAPPAAPRKETAAAPAPATSPQSVPAPGIAGGERKASAEKRIEPSPGKPAVADKPVEKPPAQSTGPKGIFAPPLAGDLKIEITGPEEALKAVKISVNFRAYPQSRHNRPMTKAQSRNIRVLTPKITRVAKNTLQAVIEIAEEGVYDFENLSDHAGPAKAAFSVKIYENSGRARTKSAGSRMIGDKGSIAKVLMPEGILWNDESAFGGSMEDSESITRFNVETGLVWKEYKE